MLSKEIESAAAIASVINERRADIFDVSDKSFFIRFIQSVKRIKKADTHPAAWAPQAKPHPAAWAPQAGGGRRVSPCTAVQDGIDTPVPV
jgi:hypothetical protein